MLVERQIVRVNKETIMRETPQVIKRWLHHFNETCKEAGPTAIAHEFVMMGPNNPEKCDCTCLEDEDEEGLWLHDHHREWNYALWLCLKAHGRLQAVRQVIRRDQKREKRQIVSKGYAQEMLDNLLTENPSERWVRR